MSRQLESYGINILKLHAEWLLVNGYKQQASSCKRQIRIILNNKKKKASSNKLQATSLTVTEGYYRMNLERNNMDTTQLKRIADALEEILRLVKQDIEKYEKKKH